MRCGRDLGVGDEGQWLCVFATQLRWIATTSSHRPDCRHGLNSNDQVPSPANPVSSRGAAPGNKR